MFFSVKVPIKIAGKAYKPCICYEVTSYLELTVDKLVKEGKADIYNKPVFFCNGKLVEEKIVKEEKTVEKPRKEKKTKEVPVKDTEELAEEAEILPPAEDEGF